MAHNVFIPPPGVFALRAYRPPSADGDKDEQHGHAEDGCPAGADGIPAIEQLTGQGISVDVTLIFSLDRYREVIAAYLAGLRTAANRQLDISRIASVASFFVSRVDAAVDRRIDDGGEGTESFRDRVAVANARLAYRIFEETLSDEDRRELEEQGARPQRPLWASTGVKKPELRDTLYVEELIAPHTVSTMPLRTLLAVADHGQLGRTSRDGPPEIRRPQLNHAFVPPEARQRASAPTNRSGVIGRSRTRTPVAWYAAFAMAAAAPTMPISPTPRVPIGLVRGSHSSSQTASMSATSACPAM